MNNKYVNYINIFIIFLFFIVSCKGENNMKKNEKILKDLNKEEKDVIVDKGTEAPFTGKFNKYKNKGTYICKRCRLPLYKSENKFDSGCGWPSFDDEIDVAVTRKPDKDGIRTEILCSYCGAHLGHVFEGEGYTKKNVRHCVNSISMDFIPLEKKLKRNRAIFAAGCFWGVEYLFKKAEGVLDTRVGYSGGGYDNPTYEDVCSGETGHAEAVEVIYNPNIISYEDLVKLFFEIHDFTQVNRQGPDIGTQYRSEIFYITEKERKIIKTYIKILEKKGYEVATQVSKADRFWVAEKYHQDYYDKTGKNPYCHVKKDIF